MACLVCERPERVWDEGGERVEGDEGRPHGMDRIILGEG